MRFDHETLPLLGEALECLDAGFDRLPEFVSEVDPEALRAVLLEVAARLQDNYPYQHPLYVGQMLKPPDAVARLAYALSLWLNLCFLPMGSLWLMALRTTYGRGQRSFVLVFTNDNLILLFNLKFPYLFLMCPYKFIKGIWRQLPF